MIRASGLYGRSVIDLDTAERIGDVDEIIVDPNGPGIAGFVVSCERSLLSLRKRVIVPMESIHAIGPDALTTRTGGQPDRQSVYLDALPRLSELTGRRMVSFGGRLLGAVEDALVDERDGRIVGYPLEKSGPSSWFESLFGLGWKSDRPDYVRADAALRIGARLIVVPDDAIAAAGDLEETDLSDVPAISSRTAPPPAEPTPDEIREAQATTAQFSMDSLQVTDEGLGLEPSAERDQDAAGDNVAHPSYDRPDVDSEVDTGVIAAADTARGRPRRRPQAERIR